MQAWGECVTTTGYGAGSRTPERSANAEYTWGFSGTSSASPIVTSAAAILSSVTKARTGVPATPARVRSVLKSTGTAQVFATGSCSGNIGPMPDLKQAIQAMAGDTTAPRPGTISQTAATTYAATGTTVPTEDTVVGDRHERIQEYLVRVNVDGAGWTSVTLPTVTARNRVFALTAGKSYTSGFAGRDGAGNWTGWKNGPTFAPTVIAENHTAVIYFDRLDADDPTHRRSAGT